MSARDTQEDLKRILGIRTTKAGLDIWPKKAQIAAQRGIAFYSDLESETVDSTGGAIDGGVPQLPPDVDAATNTDATKSSDSSTTTTEGDIGLPTVAQCYDNPTIKGCSTVMATDEYKKYADAKNGIVDLSDWSNPYIAKENPPTVGQITGVYDCVDGQDVKINFGGESADNPDFSLPDGFTCVTGDLTTGTDTIGLAETKTYGSAGDIVTISGYDENSTSRADLKYTLEVDDRTVSLNLSVLNTDTFSYVAYGSCPSNWTSAGLTPFGGVASIPTSPYKEWLHKMPPYCAGYGNAIDKLIFRAWNPNANKYVYGRTMQELIEDPSMIAAGLDYIFFFESLYYNWFISYGPGTGLPVGVTYKNCVYVTQQDKDALLASHAAIDTDEFCGWSQTQVSFEYKIITLNPTGDVICYDEASGQQFWSTFAADQYSINNDGSITVSEDQSDPDQAALSGLAEINLCNAQGDNIKILAGRDGGWVFRNMDGNIHYYRAPDGKLSYFDSTKLDYWLGITD